MNDTWLIIRAPAAENKPPFYFVSHIANAHKWKDRPAYIILGYTTGREQAKTICQGLNASIKQNREDPPRGKIYKD